MRRAHMSLQGLAVLVLLALVGSCDNDTTGIRPDRTPPLRILAELGVRHQNLSITRDGAAVTNATVTVNGVVIPHTGAAGVGWYEGQLPTPVAPGSPLNLQVSAGDTTVQGTVNVPEAPVLTAPAAGAVFNPRDTITVSWTSATNPDSFVVSMDLITPNGIRLEEKPFPVAGTARELKIPLPPEFGAGPGTTFSVFAYNEGSFTGQVDRGSRLSVRAQSPPEAPISTAASPLRILADMGAQSQNLTVTREGWAVTNATVTVNGVAIPHIGVGFYEGQLPTAVPPGSPLNLQVSVGDVTVQGTVNVPETPILIAPAAGAVFNPRDTITFSWTSGANPDRFVVTMGLITPNGSRIDLPFPVAGTTRELKIPLPPEFGAGPGTTFSVFAYNDGSFTGQVEPHSRMSIGSEGSPNVVLATATSPLRISGGVGAQSQNIWIFQGGWDLTDGVSNAVVTVNGVTVPPTALSGYYHGELPAAVPPGSPLHLRVERPFTIVEATGNVPEVPVVTTPAAGAVFAPGGSITVRWTSLTDPDRFAVYVNTNEPVWHRELPGTARELEIAASELPAGSDLAIGVVAYNDGSFTGPAHSDSRMGIMSVGGPRVITIKP